MSVIEKIRIFLADLVPGTLFAIQGIIHLGSRTAIDSALYDLRQAKLIQRAAVGVYASTPEGEKYKFEPWKVAEIKAQAFNKKIFPHSDRIIDLLKFPEVDTESEENQLNETVENEQTESTQTEGQSPDRSMKEQKKAGGKATKAKVIKFFTTGCSSSFSCKETAVRVQFISLSKKKLRNYLLEGGYWVSAVRTMGRQYFESHVDELKQKLPPFRTTLTSLKDSFVLMPIWLYSNLNIKYANRHDKRKHPLVDIPQRIPHVPQEHLDLIWGP